MLTTVVKLFLKELTWGAREKIEDGTFRSWAQSNRPVTVKYF